MDLETERIVFSVTEITRNIRFLLERNFSQAWVEGEVSGLKRHTSGHFYFSLKDETAQIACVMFRRENHALAFDLEEGMKVLGLGRVSVYPPRGQYQLVMERIEPRGIGELQLRFEQLKERLRKEGLFEESRKRPLPYLPERIGVITSIDGAAIHDILHVLDRRFSEVTVRLYPVPVQGLGAAEAIAQALDDMNRWKAADVLIVGRGGGSFEDLWAFNEEVVARAIFRSEIPVISAVGHEVDFTIADFTADRRAATPSAAAEIVLPPKRELLARTEELRLRLFQTALEAVDGLRRQLDGLLDRPVLRTPLEFLSMQRQRLDGLAGKLEALGPLSVLRRGFSATFKLPEGKVVTSSADLKRGDTVRTRLFKGFFTGEVKETG